MIYILKCKDETYYIGRTVRPIERIEEHFAQHGSEWTKLHPPIRVIREIDTTDAMDEDKYTKIYMRQYGIDKVRGGTYVQIRLPDYQIKTLQDEMRTIEDSCFICGSVEHYAKDCDGKLKLEQPLRPLAPQPVIKCFKCNRVGHYASACSSRRGRRRIHPKSESTNLFDSVLIQKMLDDAPK